MAVDEQLISLVAEFVQGDENAFSLEDPLWSEDGGPLEPGQVGEFLEAVENEFGISVRSREAEKLDTIADLLKLVQQRVENP